MRTLIIDARKLHDSGIGRYLRNLLPGLSSRLTADHVRVLAVPDQADEVTGLVGKASAGGPVTVQPVHAAPHTVAEQNLAFAPGVRGAALWVPHYNVPLLHRGPLVVTVHDLAPIDFAANFGAGASRLLKKAMGQLLLRTAVHRAQTVLTVSHFTQQRLKALLAVDPGRIVVTPLAVDVAWPSLADAPAAHVESDGKPYLLFVGNMKPNKNLPLLLEALRLLQRRGNPGPRLLVVGKTSGFLTPDGQIAAGDAVLGDAVRFLGQVSDTTLIALYRGASAMVMPSRYEGFGLPLLEAMRYGCPVLSSDAASLPEAAGGAALLFSPDSPVELAEAILALRDPQTSVKLREAGLLREAAANWQSAIDQTALVLNAASDAAGKQL